MSKRTFYQRYGEKLIQRGDPFICHYCKKPLIEKGYKYGDPEFYNVIKEVFRLRNGEYRTITNTTLKPSFGIASVDHVIPRRNGGTNELSNLVLSCWSCNTNKNAKPYEKFMKEISYE